MVRRKNRSHSVNCTRRVCARRLCVPLALPLTGLRPSCATRSRTPVKVRLACAVLSPYPAPVASNHQQAWYREPNRQQWAALLSAWAGWVLVAFDFCIFLMVIPALAKEFDVSITAVTGAVTVTLILRLIGGYLAGSAADRFGRRAVLIASIVAFALFDGSVALAPALIWVLIARALFGFAMGAEWTAGTLLAMENWPDRSRGIASGILQGSWALGYLLAAAVSAFVLPKWGWRGLFIMGLVPALVVIPIRWWAPEGKKPVVAQVTQEDDGVFSKENVPRLVWASLIMALGFTVYYALVSLYPTMLYQEFRLGPQEVSWNVILFNLGSMSGAVVCGIIAVKKGIRFAVILPAVVVLPFLPMYVGVWPELLGWGAFLTAAIGISWSGIVPMFLTELFPAAARARSVGITYHVGACTAAFVPPAVSWLAEGFSLSGAIAVFAGVANILLVGLLLLRPQQAAPVPPLPEASSGAPG